MKAPTIHIPVQKIKEREYTLDKIPVLTPSEEDWKDPLAYISKISGENKKFGLCKIIPPKDWNPQFSLDSSTFWFKTRIQNLSSLHGLNRASKNYLMNLIKFHSQSTDSYISRPPIVDKRHLDLLLLRNLVEEFGGYEKVSIEKKWKLIAQEMGYSNQGWIAKAIGLQYEKWIKPFIEFTSCQDRKFINQDALESTKNVGIMKFSSREMVQAVPILVKKQQTSDGLFGVCSICTKGDDEDKLLLCDGCNKGFHLYCLEPKLEFVPFSDWYCGECLKETDGNFGFDDGKVRCLYEFQYISNKFKRDWFFKKTKSYKISAQDVEDEFWRLVHSPFQDVEVEYGADLHSMVHGSGFPTLEKNPHNKYSKCSWNLNNLPILSKSVFRHIKSDISGMIVPWLYVGMVFSAFCWHVEDHNTYSINYLHWGEPKTWYGIPASDADKFESVMKSLMPELFDANPDLLFHLTTMVSPWELKKHGVSVYTIDQHAGEFVVTFPRSYHAGFNQGFNFAEAVNFALPDWFDLGRECIERYREYCKNPVFCHDELLFATANSDLDPENAKWLASDMTFIVEKTLNGRKALMEEYGSRLTFKKIEYTTNDDRPISQCFKCRAFCFTNAVFCKCTLDKVSCEAHVKDVIECSCFELIVEVRFSDKELLELRQKVDSSAELAAGWSDRLMELLRENERPQISDLNSLLLSIEKSEDLTEEMVDLKAFMLAANNWIVATAGALAKVGQRQADSDKKRDTVSRVETLFGPKKTLFNYYLLLDEANRMAFDCPELQLLKEAISQVEVFRDKAKMALATPGQTCLKELYALYNEGLALETGIEEIFELGERIKIAEWEENAQNLISQAVGDIKPFSELIKSGLEMQISHDNPKLISLKLIKATADDWRDRAHTIIRLSKLKIDSLFYIEKLLSESKQNPYYRATLQQLEKMYNSIKIWHDQACEIFDQDAAGKLILEKMKTKDYDKVRNLLMEGEALNMELEIPKLLTFMSHTENWLQRGRKVLGRNKSPKSLSQILAELSNNVESFAKFEDQEKSICFCKKDSEGQISQIVCVKCNHTYHINCVKITKKMMKTMTNFVCFVCSNNVDSIKDYEKLPSLADLQGYLIEGQSLTLIPAEVHILQSIVQKLREFKKCLFEFLRKDDGSDKEFQMKLVRHVVGLDVTIDPETSQLKKRLECTLLDGQDVTEMPANDSGPRYCICREIYTPDKPMIGCDECSEWYHWECLGLSAKNVEAMRDEGFICTVCSPEGTKINSRSVVLSASNLHNKTPTRATKKSMLSLDEEDDRDFENYDSDSSVRVTKKIKVKNDPTSCNQTKENLLYSTTVGSMYDSEGNQQLLPPPPIPWSNNPPLALDSITSNNSLTQYPVPTFLYSPFAWGAKDTNIMIQNEFLDE